jgi:DnaJ like chaperone protein
MTILLLNIEDYAGLFAGLGFFLIVLIILIYAFYNLVSAILMVFGIEKKSRLGRATEHNKILAFQAIGTHMVLLDKAELNTQIAYLVQYLKRIFPRQQFNRNDLIAAYQDIKFNESMLKWIKTNLNETEKLILVEFLIDLAFHNHDFTRRELAFINHVGNFIGLNKEDVQSILRIRYEQRNRTNEQRRQQSEQRPSKKSVKVRALQVLGLPASTSDLEEVRKAYRSLARKHHPDRFANSSKEEQQLAHERFTEITNAHDTLRELMK